MSNPSDSALGLSRALLRLFVALNFVGLALLLSGFVASFVFEEVVAQYYRQREMDAAILIPTLRVWLLLGVPLFAVLQVLLSRLLEIVGTVRLGHPFVRENAMRLRTIAWCLVAVQLLHLSFGVMARFVVAANAHVDWSFSLTGWLAVLLLFVLARVFEEGARIRDDLDAMI